jgi:hypothetical protein
MRRAYAVLVLVILAACTGEGAAVEGRAILVCVAAGAAPALHDAAQSLITDADRIPLFAALRQTQGAGMPVLIDSATLMDEKAAWNKAAFNHLVVIGIPGRDTLLDKVWGYDTRIDVLARSTWMEGYGHLTGELGLVACDRNPFLHSPRIERSDVDTCLVTLSGTSEGAVVAAVSAFRGGLANGLVPVGRLERPQATILDLDPSPELPPAMIGLPGHALFAGWTQCAGNEYRAVLDAGEHEPQRLWRLKWLLPGSLDGMGGKPWVSGMHRLAFGNAADIARFPDAATAAHVAAAIATAARGTSMPAIAGEAAWQLDAPTDEVVVQGTVRSTIVTSQRAYLIMATLTREQIMALADAVAH